MFLKILQNYVTYDSIFLNLILIISNIFILDSQAWTRDIKSRHWNAHLPCVNPDDRFRQEV